MSLELYHSGNSPFVRKVLVAARVLGLRDKLVIIETAPLPTKLLPDLNAHNPLATIPTLVTPNGPIFDSPVIIQYLDALSGGGKLLPPSTDLRRYEALTYEKLCDGTLGAMLLVRYEGAVRTPEQQSAAWVAGQTGKAQRGVAQLAKLPLPDIAAPTLPLQAIALASVVWYLDRRFAHLEWRKNWEGAGVLGEWYGRAEKVAAWADEVAPAL